jgi:thiazole synthase
METRIDRPLVIAGQQFSSRLMVGTGKYRSSQEMNAAFEASGAQIITVALRRIDFDDPASRSVLEDVDWKKYTILPNTAGCQTAEEAIRIARMARAMELSNWVKLEVIPDPKYLLPDPIGTLEAARVLVDEGFVVLPYIGADPILARRLEELGTATVMPLGSPIGSGQGIINIEAIKIIIEQASVPVVVDAGIGVPSETQRSPWPTTRRSWVKLSPTVFAPDAKHSWQAVSRSSNTRQPAAQSQASSVAGHSGCPKTCNLSGC